MIVDEGLVDAAFVAARTEDFEALARTSRATAPRRWRRSAASPAATLRDVARAFATPQGVDDPLGHGRPQHVHGTDNARCLIALCAADRPDRPARHRAAPAARPEQRAGRVRRRADPDDAARLPARDRRRRRAPRSRRCGARRSTGSPGLTVVEIMHAGRRRGRRSAACTSWARTRRCPTRTWSTRARAGAARAPGRAGHLPHRDRVARRRGAAGLGLAGEDRHRHQHRPHGAARPAGARPARARRARTSGSSRRWRARLGLDWHYGRRATAWPRSSRRCARRCRRDRRHHAGQRLEREGSVTYPCPTRTTPASRSCSSTASRPPSGRAQLVPADIIPADERPDADYPLVLITGRQLEHWHTGSMTRRAAVLDAIEPDATASMHPPDLARARRRAGRASSSCSHAAARSSCTSAPTRARPTARCSSPLPTARRRRTC